MRMSLKALGLVSALVLAPIAASPVKAEESHGSSGPMTGGTMNDESHGSSGSMMGGTMNDESHGSSGSMMGGTMSNDSTDSVMKMMKMMMEMNQNMMSMMNMMEKMNAEKMSTWRMNADKEMMSGESHDTSGSMMGGMASNDSTDGMKMGMGGMSKMMNACAKMMESRAGEPEQPPKKE